MPLPGVDDESLGVWLFGPGTGELVLVRAPGKAWLVIDGCPPDVGSYAQRVLDHYGERPSLVVMTHPHLDHAKGLREVIEQATRGPVETWPKLGMVPAPQTDGVGDTWDAFASLEGGIAEQVVATILSRWQADRADCRWELDVGSTRQLGDAHVRVLSPTKTERNAAVEAWTRDRGKSNHAASALLVSWMGRRVLLGSDLEERPGGGWTSALSHDHDLREHDVYKIAHHGSKGAIGPQVRKPNIPSLRVWIGTPFACHSQGLPRANDGEGLEDLLAIEDEVIFTGLPRRHAAQGGVARTFHRSDLRDDPERAFPEGPAGFPDCWVHVRLPRKGPATTTQGPGSVRIMR